MNRIFVATLAVALGAPLYLATPSEACLHVVEFTKKDAVATVSRAERLLSRGRAVEAYRASRRARRELERSLRNDGPDARTTALITRSHRITAVAVVRLDGWTPITRQQARRNVVRGREARSLAWAAGQLRTFAAENPDDLRAQAFLGEALARIPLHRTEAREILSSLARRDLMPDAHGYAALLRVVDAGSAEWQEALTRCEQMASDASSQICPAASGANATHPSS